jgi:hypothetical protein
MLKQTFPDKMMANGPQVRVEQVLHTPTDVFAAD